MAKYEVKAEVRTGTGKEKAAKVRQAGNSPAIIYGADKDPISLTVNTRDSEAILSRIHGEKVLVDVVIGNSVEKAFVRNIQRDPVTEKLLHIDFYRVDMNREIETKVSVTEVGIAEGVKLGGMLEHVVRQLSIRCLPGDVPPHIEVNVERLQQGQNIHVKDIPAISGVRIITSPDAVLFAVTGKVKEEAVAPKA